MRNEMLIAETGRLLAALSEEQARTVRDFAAFLAQQSWNNLPLVNDELLADETEEEFAADIRAIQQHSRAYDFLHNE
ncbi:hypothetical protein A0257_13805 [Hymenobacter psoromatis]|nr:hypothetical protein A0257_13805 [Hymenobacter psoromatis]